MPNWIYVPPTAETEASLECAGDRGMYSVNIETPNYELKLKGKLVETFTSISDALNAAEEAMLGDEEQEEPQPDESMDGDHDSAMASAGFGTDEDYGDFGGGEE